MAIHIGDYKIALDTRDPAANVNFISHAHSDHLDGIRKNKRAISSIITKELIETRNCKVSIDLVDNPSGIRLLNAGHILGSKQLHGYSSEEGLSILYSGDYQMQESVVSERIETVTADVLIIDSTYPYKNIKFDDRNEVTHSIQKYVSEKTERGIVLFGAYALGKAQELIRIMNEAGISSVVDEKISRINKIYERHGVALDYLSISDNEEEFNNAVRANFVGITEVSRLSEVSKRLSTIHGERVFTAVATGFAKVFSFDTDVQFCLSDHADFSQALEYISLCNPKMIYTYGNRASAEVFAKNLSSAGYKASTFETKATPALNK